MKKKFVGWFFGVFLIFGALVSSGSSAHATTPSFTSVMAVSKIYWSSDCNGYNRCVSFTDGGMVPYSIVPGYVSVKYWHSTTSTTPDFKAFFAPDRRYKWRISNGIMYIRWYGATTAETLFPLHPYGTTSQYCYVIQITRADVVVTVDGLPGFFSLGSKIPLVPISGASGEFTFTGPSDMTGTATENTGFWVRPVKGVAVFP